LGIGGELFAQGCEENLRMIIGNVDGTGAIDAGTGFTCQRIDEGDYVFVFSTPVSDVPTMTISTQPELSVARGRWGHVRSIDRFGARVWIRDNTNGGYQNSDFSFWVIGPR